MNIPDDQLQDALLRLFEERPDVLQRAIDLHMANHPPLRGERGPKGDKGDTGRDGRDGVPGRDGQPAVVRVMPQKGVEKTRVTKFDEQGRILEFERIYGED